MNEPPNSAEARPPSTPPRPRETPWQRTKSNILTILGAVGIAMVIRVMLFEAFEIEGPSMEPTLLNGDRVVVAKYLYGLFLPGMDAAIVTWGHPNRGDVVIVKSPADNIDIVKRVIGLPGDSIEIRDDVVLVNGRPLRRRDLGPCEFESGMTDPTGCQWVEEGLGGRTFVTSHSILSQPTERPRSVVPANHVYILGDHRDRSNDSRYFGPVPFNRVKGRALAIYWSNDHGVRLERMGHAVR